MKMNHVHKKIMWMLKGILTSYIVTTLLLLLVTVFLYKLNMNNKLLTAAIVAIYVLSTFTGGLILGKCAGQRRFLWGAALGVLYFLLLIVITLLVYRKLGGSSVSTATTLILCMGGGMLGGMVS